MRTGNHALNQSIGLLDVGCYLGRTDWQASPAGDRRFITRAIDRQGVSEEQATKYDRYDYERFMLLRDHLLACGLPAPAGFARVQRIPDFLAQATRPDGHYETIGDSDDRGLAPIRGTAEEYPAEPRHPVARLLPRPSPRSVGDTCSGAPAGAGATAGRSGTRPSSRSGSAPGSGITGTMTVAR